MFRFELRRALHWKRMLMAFGVLAILYYSSYSHIDWINLLKFPNHSLVYAINSLYLPPNGARDLLPFAAALPYAASIAEDLDSRWLPAVLPRSDFRRFALSRYMAACTAGGAALMMTRLLFLLLLLIRGAVFVHKSDLLFYSPHEQWLIQHQAVALYIALQCLFQFVSGFWAAGFSLCVGLFTNRKGVIYTFATFLLIIISQVSSFQVLDFFAGESCLFSDSMHPLTAPIAVTAAGLALSALFYMVFQRNLKRRLYR